MQQDLKNKRGEIEFRRRLFRQQVEGEALFEDELDMAGIEEVLRDRISETRTDMQRLRDDGITLSPYLEIGAERGQRALVLENDLGAEGAALDLSLDLLRSCEHYRARFGMDRLPLRICADAYALPFRSGSLPFVFCYQTLHHFPSLEPIISEVHRVLAPGGHFFFAEEPYRRTLHWNLIRSKGGLRGRGNNPLQKLFRRLFVDEVYNEEEFGVLENHDIPLRDWKSTLRTFEAGSATLELASLQADMDRPRNPLTFLALKLLGGRIRGVYRKAGELRDHANSIEEALVSPAGLSDGSERPLRREGSFYVSDHGERFSTVDGVAMLLPPATERELYPEVADR